MLLMHEGAYHEEYEEDYGIGIGEAEENFECVTHFVARALSAVLLSVRFGFTWNNRSGTEVLQFLRSPLELAVVVANFSWPKKRAKFCTWAPRKKRMAN